MQLEDAFCSVEQSPLSDIVLQWLDDQGAETGHSWAPVAGHCCSANMAPHKHSRRYNADQ